MTHLNDDDLSALLDGEQTAGREHLDACGECLASFRRLQKLEGVLLRDTGEAAPPADATVNAVRRRLRPVAAGWAWIPVAAAAAILLTTLPRVQPPATPPSDPTPAAELVAAYVGTEDPALADRIVAKGDDGIRALADMLSSDDPMHQIAAAKLLGRFEGESVREILLASRAAAGYAGDEMDLLAPEPFAQPDDDLGTALLNVSDVPDYSDLVEFELPRADLMAALKSDNPELQEGAVVIILKSRNPRFEVADLIEMMDAPVLKKKLLRILPELTGEDHGDDAEAWKDALRRLAARRT